MCCFESCCKCNRKEGKATLNKSNMSEIRCSLVRSFVSSVRWRCGAYCRLVERACAVDEHVVARRRQRLRDRTNGRTFIKTKTHKHNTNNKHTTTTTTTTPIITQSHTTTTTTYEFAARSIVAPLAAQLGPIRRSQIPHAFIVRRV
jgi:hypothetical protein